MLAKRIVERFALRSWEHVTLKETTAMSSGLKNHIWTIRELIEESVKF